MCCARSSRRAPARRRPARCCCAICRTQPRQICSCSREAQIVRVADDAALAAAQRDVDDRALPGHPHRERAHGVERLLRVKADAALATARAHRCAGRGSRGTLPAPSSMRTGMAKEYSRIGERRRSRSASRARAARRPGRTAPAPYRMHRELLGHDVLRCSAWYQNGPDPAVRSCQFVRGRAIITPLAVAGGPRRRARGRGSVRLITHRREAKGADA